MKYILMALMIVGCGEKKPHWPRATVYSAATMIAMPEYYRKVTGYDSIQLIVESSNDSIWANFCYPNNLKK